MAIVDWKKGDTLYVAAERAGVVSVESVKVKTISERETTVAPRVSAFNFRARGSTDEFARYLSRTPTGAMRRLAANISRELDDLEGRVEYEKDRQAAVLARIREAEKEMI